MLLEPLLAWLLPFLSAYKWVLLFYGALIILIYLNRRKLDWQAKFIGLYRTKVGLKLMDRLGKHERPVRRLGDLGVIVGFLGMLLIVAMLFKGLYDLLFVPGAPPVISPVLPGVTIPGMGIKVPLIIGWLALFVVIVIHEFSHGVVARAWRIPVKSSGLMLFGPLGGAFVEPDEERLKKQPTRVKLALYAAGPFSNLLSAGLFVLLLSFVLAPLLLSLLGTGVVFSEVTPGYPAALAGVAPGVVYTAVDGVPVADRDAFLAALDGLAPGDEVLLSSAEEEVTIVAGPHPDDPARGYLGVILGENLANPSLRWLFLLLLWLVELITWAFILSIGIGLANLLPIGPVDGGRMLQALGERLFGAEQGNKVWAKVTLLMLVIVGLLLLIPFVIKPLLTLLR